MDKEYNTKGLSEKRLLKEALSLGGIEQFILSIKAHKRRLSSR